MEIPSWLYVHVCEYVGIEKLHTLWVKNFPTNEGKRRTKYIYNRHICMFVQNYLNKIVEFCAAEALTHNGSTRI